MEKGGGGAERRRTRLELTENQSQRGDSKFFPSDNRHFIVDVFMKTEYKSPWASTVITLSVS